MLGEFLRGLEQPEYVHVLLNPVPVYGLAAGLAALMIALALRSRKARICAFALILFTSASAWPVSQYGQKGYFRVKTMSDSEGRNWLDEHKRRGDQLVFAFYLLAASTLLSLGAEWKASRAALPLAIATVVLATSTLGVAAYIGYAGGHIRHKEFRFEPAPQQPPEATPKSTPP